jgi:hypothetical protein
MVEEKKVQIPAHKALGTLLQELLTPVGIKVVTEFQVMAESPRGDILILRRQQSAWTPAQRALLPDGIRDSEASDILLEFKYTEVVNKMALCQALGYGRFYCQSQRLTKTEVQTFILSAKTPTAKTLRKFGYKQAEQPGVYRSDNIMLEGLPLLVLNELRDEPHNAFVKSFASRYLARKAALETLKGVGLQTLSPTVQTVLNFLWRQWTMVKEGEMELEITPEQIIELARQWQEMMWTSLSPEEVLSHFKPEERLAGLEPEEVLPYFKPEEVLPYFKPEEVLPYFKPEEVLPYFKPEERLAGLEPEERLAGLEPEERLAGLEPEERLAGLEPEEVLPHFKPEERLAGLSVEEIEAYLRKLKSGR